MSSFRTLDNVNLAPDTFVVANMDKLAFLDPMYAVMEVCGEYTTEE